MSNAAQELPPFDPPLQPPKVPSPRIRRRFSKRCGSIFGVDVFTSIGFFFCFLLLSLLAVLCVPGLIELLGIENGDFLNDFSNDIPGSSTALTVLFAFTCAICGYLCTVLPILVTTHTFLKYEQGVDAICLGTRGGFVVLANEQSRSLNMKELAIIIFSGIMCNVILGLIFMIGSLLVSAYSGFGGLLVGFLMVFNFVFAIFSCLPFYPVSCGLLCHYKLQHHYHYKEVDRRLCLISFGSWIAIFLVTFAPINSAFTSHVAIFSGGFGLLTLIHCFREWRQFQREHVYRTRDFSAPHVPVYGASSHGNQLYPAMQPVGGATRTEQMRGVPHGAQNSSREQEYANI